MNTMSPIQYFDNNIHIIFQWKYYWQHIDLFTTYTLSSISLLFFNTENGWQHTYNGQWDILTKQINDALIKNVQWRILFSKLNIILYLKKSFG